MIEKLSERCEEIREKLIDVVSKNGGHLGPNLGVVELTVSLNEVFDFSKDILLFDVGHQSYIYKILTDREERFTTLRCKDGISPFMDPSESQYDHFISGHAGTALPAAVGFAIANPDKKVIVVVGDASIANGHSLEALNYIGYKKIENIVVILNDNEMSIGKNVGYISKLLEKIILSKTYRNFRTEVKSLVNRIKANTIKEVLERLESSLKNFLTPLYVIESIGFNFFGAVDGHNLEDLLLVFKKIKKSKGPTLVVVKTQKGKGYSFAVEDKEKFHGIAPFDIKTGKTKKSNTKSYSEVFGEKIVRIAEEDNDIFTLSAGMIKGTCLDDFNKNFPERCIDTGIAEGFLVTLAAALAKSGKKPYACIYSTFLQRALSQLIHDVSVQNLPVRFVIDRAGIVGQDGKTHNGVYDLSLFLSIENFTVLCPTTSRELQQALDISKDFNNGPLVIRIAKDSVFELDVEQDLKIGKWKEIRKGNKNLFIATGSMLKEIVEINDKLIEKGISGTIVSAASVKPFDEEYLLNSIKNYDNIFILEETYMRNSFSTAILEFLNDNGINRNIHRLSLRRAIIPHAKREEILAEEGLKGENLIERIEEFIHGEKQ
ncbi:1-deoxy-D-xylulose-5-phosphate synthase [Fusobacterium russii]|uniref:1-deoxy-D-xylulose-5-phosphate synthase n=1 Tax=Fusobacterium russii TaxID=854 RepID=UPI00039B178C|nr:1-deoxy-D-xylulose-5-phosphate synthase [Fusobacterium russii]